MDSGKAEDSLACLYIHIEYTITSDQWIDVSVDIVGNENGITINTVGLYRTLVYTHPPFTLKFNSLLE